MKVLLAYYHPVIVDLAKSLAKHLKFEVYISVNTKVSDHYGSHADLLKMLKVEKDFKAISLNEALVKLKLKQFDLVGCDGVYDGDKDIMEVCKQGNVPYFCISGYPYLRDEADAKNILSFSWFMPQFQYLNTYPTEGHVKEVAHKKLLNGEQNKKNIYVFYPEFNHVRDFTKENPRLLARCRDYSSFIHRYKECNKSLYDIFTQVCAKTTHFNIVKNYTNLSNRCALEKMNESKGLCMIKGYDCPGIALLEAMLIGCVPFIFQEYVLGSFNQEVLIDGHSCVMSDSVAEFVDNLEGSKWATTSKTTQDHAMMLTDFKRQQNKLEKFFDKCLKQK